MSEIIVIAIGIFMTGAICQHIGYKAGFEAGREHELDKAAQRHVRMSRFSDMQHKKG